MSQDFRSKYESLLENDPGGVAGSGEANEASNGTNYASSSHVRNLAFTWPDGRKLFLNYSYLVSCEYIPPAGKILLAFTTHKVLLDGVRLETLFDQLMAQIPRIIICQEVRYNAISEDLPIVNMIEVIAQQ